MGDLDAEDADCRYIAQNTPCVIVAVDYRHAPEYTLNDILDDALEGYEWVSFNLNPRRSHLTYFIGMEKCRGARW